LVRYVN